MPLWTPPIKVANVIQSDIPIAWTIGRVSGFSNGAGCFRINNSGHGGRVAQLGEHLLCKQGVAGSNPVTSTIFSIACGTIGPSVCSFVPCFVP